jgi:hypothetical protein
MVSPWTGPLEYSKHYYFISLLAINGNGSKNKAKKKKNFGVAFSNASLTPCFEGQHRVQIC